MQPTDSLEEAVANLEAYIPSFEAISTFYATKDTDENKCVDLIPRRTGTAVGRGPLPKWIFIPTTFIPKLIKGLPPQIVWKHVRYVVGRLPKAFHPLFALLLWWKSAACMQQGGAGAQRASSQTAIKWRTPHMTAHLTNWAVCQMQSQPLPRGG
jgi:hypothetical protein